MAQASEHHVMKRFGWVLITSFPVLGIGLSAVFHPAPKFIWNTTASTPVGLYVLSSDDDLHVGDLVSIIPPEPAASFLAEGGYLPRNIPLLKHVLALQGQVVCRGDRTITVNGLAVGEALERDSHGRLLPVWQGCRRLAAGELFVMNRHVRESFDGRYFGPFPANSVVGRAMPLWTEDDNTMSLGKHAPAH
jgi:conjugative transfer signal peptidase TraF